MVKSTRARGLLQIVGPGENMVKNPLKDLLIPGSLVFLQLGFQLHGSFLIPLQEIYTLSFDWLVPSIDFAFIYAGVITDAAPQRVVQLRNK